MTVEYKGVRRIAATVIFEHPVQFRGFDETLQPGSYRIETCEEIYQGSFEPIYVASGISIFVERTGGISMFNVTPEAFRAALASDGQSF